MDEEGEIWNESKDFPSELSPAGNSFSVDVLIYNKRTDEHSIGWFNFKTMSWLFLCRESQKDFKWRYLQYKNDKF